MIQFVFQLKISFFVFSFLFVVSNVINEKETELNKKKRKEKTQNAFPRQRDETRIDEQQE